jgi:lipoprotein-anchoring transpeptidase ErfK/SrfK
MRTARTALAAAVLGIAALALPSAASAARTLPPGSTIAGVDVSGLGPGGAGAKLKAELPKTWERPIAVRAAGTGVTITAAEAGQFIRYNAMVDRAFELVRQGQTTAINVALMRQIRRGVLRRAVAKVAARWYRAPRNATLRYGITRIRARGGRLGRAVDERALRIAVVGELTAPTPERTLHARLVRVRPAITIAVLKRTVTFVSVDRGPRLVRLFKRLRVVRTYRVAVGAAGYDTPRGLHRVLYKERNPAWHAPNRPWAGNLAGQTIPPGDPRNPLLAAFIALGGGVGFHGTANLASIGQAASHGCIRMAVPDVLSLYRNVPVGTPVLVR